MSKHFEVARPDYPAVPAAFHEIVCRCRGQAYCSPLENWQEGYREDELKNYPLKFPWWVCSQCLKPAPLNVLRARIIRECESCEEPYLIITWPDLMNLCEDCNG